MLTSEADAFTVLKEKSCSLKKKRFIPNFTIVSSMQKGYTMARFVFQFTSRLEVKT